MSDPITAYELATDARHFGDLDKLAREQAYIERRQDELTSAGQMFDPNDPKIVEDAFGDCPKLDVIAACLAADDAAGMLAEVRRIVKEYALAAAYDEACREIGYGD